MTVLLIFFIFLTITILGISLNVAELFVWHGHLQTSLDCAVYSGAVKQARGLNEIALKNSAIKEEWDELRTKWKGGKLFSRYNSGSSNREDGRQTAERDWVSFTLFNEWTTARQHQINREKAREAYVMASAIALNNEPTAEFSDWRPEKKQLTELVEVSLPPARMQFKYRDYYWVYPKIGPPVRRTKTVITSYNRSLPVRIVQKAYPYINTYYCGRLLKPSQEYIFRFKDKDGVDLLDRVFRNMRTYATAIPYGGKLWDRDLSVGIAKYDVKLVRTGAVYPQPSIPNEDRTWGYKW